MTLMSHDKWFLLCHEFVINWYILRRMKKTGNWQDRGETKSKIWIGLKLQLVLKKNKKGKEGGEV